MVGWEALLSAKDARGMYLVVCVCVCVCVCVGELGKMGWAMERVSGIRGIL